MADLPLAHSGHWLVDLAFASPFAGLLIWLIVTTARERRRAGRGEPSEGAEAGVEGPEA